MKRPSKRNRRSSKKQIAKKPPAFMKLWVLLASVGLAGAIAYYFNESDEEERKVTGVVRMLGNPDLDTRRLALKTLDDCLYEQKILLSTTTDIPQPKSILISHGCVEALFDAMHDGDEEIKERSILWLIRLSEELEARQRIFRIGLSPIIDLINNIDSNSTLWLTSSSLLLELSRHTDSVDQLANEKVFGAVSRLHGSSNPIAKLVSANLYKSLTETERGKSNASSIKLLQTELAINTNQISAAALRAAVQVVIPKEPFSQNPALSFDGTSEVVLRALTFGIFGGAWGRFRWWLYARRKGLRRPEIVKFLAKRKTGRYVFTLMIMDLVAQGLMLWPEEGIVFPLISDQPVHFPNLGLPITTAVPIAEAVLVTALSLWAIRTQRYVVLPMALASLQSHWSTVDKYTKPYQQILGIDANKFPEFVFHQVKVGVSTAADYAKDLVPTTESKKDK